MLHGGNLFGGETHRAAHLQDDRCTGFLLFTAEQFTSRHNQMDTSALDGTDRADRTRQFAFESAHKVNILHEVGGPERVSVIEKFVAD